MASQEYSKTLILGGGPADDIPEFLQESPSMAYVENGRYERKDAISKALPYERPTITGAPTTFGLNLSERAGKAVLLSDHGSVYEWEEGDAAWTSTDSNCIPAKNTRLARLVGQSSRRADFATLDGYTVIVWDVVNVRVGAGPASEVFVTVFDDEGRVTINENIDNAYGPRVAVGAANNLIFIYYLNATGSLYYRALNTSTGLLSSAILSFGGVDLDLPWLAAAAANFPGLGAHSGHSNNDPSKRPAWRSSFMEDGGQRAYFDVAFDFSGTYGAMVYSYSNNLYVRRINALGTVGSPILVGTGSASAPFVPLAIGIDTAQNMCVMGYRYNTATNAATLSCLVYNSGDILQRTYSTTVPNDGLPVNGTVVPTNIGGKFGFAYTESPQVPWEMRLYSSTFLARVRWGDIDASSDNEYGFIPHVRLASKGAYDTFRANVLTSGLAVVVQQFMGACDPWAEGDGRNIQVNSPIWNKNVTSVLVRLPFDAAEDYKLISSYDAAQSKAIVGSGQEQDIFLGRLERPSTTEFRYCNRVNAEPEDIGFRNTMDYDANEAERKCVLSPGAAEYRVYKTEYAQQVSAQNYGDLVLYDTGIPLCWDGLQLREAYPLDTPELIWYRGSTTDPNHFQYQITHATLPEWRNVSLVWGFVDATQTLHRSAPSITAWVEGLEEASASEEGSWFNFTRPISAVQTDNAYFIDLHVGVGSNDPQLVKNALVTTERNVGTSGAVQFVDRTRAAGDTQEVVRRSRTVYTAGGVLAADTLPSFKDFTIAANRLFASDGGSVIYFSKLFEANIFPEFNASFTIDLGRNRNVTALEALDEKIIAFTKNEIFVISNTGPDNTGANGDFFVDTMQTTVGALDPEGVVKTPDGLMFFAPQTKTFYLLTRDLQLVEVGLAVQHLTQDIDDIRGSCLYAGEREVRFYVTATPGDANGETPATGAGIPTRPPTPRFRHVFPASFGCFAYNYEYKRWSVNTLPASPASVIMLDDAPTFHQSNNVNNHIYIQRSWDTDADVDLNTDQKLKVRLPWTRTQNLQSFGRFKAFEILGRYLSSWTKDSADELCAGDVQVNLYYDYNSLDIGDTYRYRANVAGDLGYNRMQIGVRPGQQKAQAVQLEIVEVDTEKLDDDEPTYRTGRGFSIEGVDVRFEPKRGLASKNNTLGSTK